MGPSTNVVVICHVPPIEHVPFLRIIHLRKFSCSKIAILLYQLQVDLVHWISFANAKDHTNSMNRAISVISSAFNFYQRLELITHHHYCLQWIVSPNSEWHRFFQCSAMESSFDPVEQNNQSWNTCEQLWRAPEDLTAAQMENNEPE